MSRAPATDASACRAAAAAAAEPGTAGVELVRLLLRRHRRPCVVTAGTFDGVHAGHRALVGLSREIARDRGLDVVAVTFSPRPGWVLGRDDGLPDLCGVPERIARLRAAGADDVVVVPFTRPVARIDPVLFAGLLVRELGLRALVVGEDFAVGRDWRGDVDALRAAGLELITMPDVRGADGRKLSSSALRRERMRAPVVA